MLILYNLIYIFLLPLLILRDLITIDKNKLKIILQKLGCSNTKQIKASIWLHGVSLGEIKILSSLARRLDYQGHNVLITSTTNTGRAELEKNFSDSNIKFLPFPYDLNFVHKKIINDYDVKKIVLFESEFWPNLLNLSSKVKIISLNTSISDQSFSRYKSMKFFTTLIFSKIDLFLAQSKETINRLNILGASNTKLLGNMKINPENYSTDEKKKQKYAKILATDVLNIVLGSSHNGEEEFVIDALEGLNINLILAPRHPERINKVLQIVESKGYKPIKVSDVENYGQIKQIDGKTITIFDEVGDLINLYSVVDLAIVAGSIIFDKGHNFMEPIFANTLCITGSKLNNYKQLKKDLCDTNQIETFETKNQLRALVDKYKDSVIRNEKLSAQQKALEDLSGSYELIIDSLNDV